MGALIKIKNQKYTFYSDGRNLFVQTNDGLRQKFIIQTQDFKTIGQYEYAGLIDLAYKRKLGDMDSFTHHIARFRLVPTSRTLE